MVLGKRGKDPAGVSGVPADVEGGSVSRWDFAIRASKACSVSLSWASWLLCVKQPLKASIVGRKGCLSKRFGSTCWRRCLASSILYTFFRRDFIPTMSNQLHKSLLFSKSDCGSNDAVGESRDPGSNSRTESGRGEYEFGSKST